MTCLDGDHTMTHYKPVQCGDPPVIAHATPLGGCSVTITYGKHVEYQCEAGYHVESGRTSRSKPEGCHAKEHAEPKQPVQAPEEPMGAVSSYGHVDPLEERVDCVVSGLVLPLWEEVLLAFSGCMGQCASAYNLHAEECPREVRA